MTEKEKTREQVKPIIGHQGEGRKMTGNDIVENNQYTTFVMTR